MTQAICFPRDQMTGPLRLRKLETPLGTMLAAAHTQGVCLLEFQDRKNIESQIASLRRWFEAEITSGSHPHLSELSKQLRAYFKGQRKRFTVPLSVPGTAFQQQVWRALLEIPHGQTISYQEQAGRLGNVKAVRAVASTNARNRIAIVIPCHRVIGKNGRLTGYAGSLARKQALLALEQGRGI